MPRRKIKEIQFFEVSGQYIKAYNVPSFMVKEIKSFIRDLEKHAKCFIEATRISSIADLDQRVLAEMLRSIANIAYELAKKYFRPFLPVYVGFPKLVAFDYEKYRITLVYDADEIYRLKILVEPK